MQISRSPSPTTNGEENRTRLAPTKQNHPPHYTTMDTTSYHTSRSNRCCQLPNLLATILPCLITIPVTNGYPQAIQCTCAPISVEEPTVPPSIEPIDGEQNRWGLQSISYSEQVHRPPHQDLNKHCNTSGRGSRSHSGAYQFSHSSLMSTPYGSTTMASGSPSEQNAPTPILETSDFGHQKISGDLIPKNC